MQIITRREDIFGGKTAYEILGIDSPETADKDEIKEAYKRASKGADAATVKVLQTARDILTSETHRAVYDAAPCKVLVSSFGDVGGDDVHNVIVVDSAKSQGNIEAQGKVYLSRDSQVSLARDYKGEAVSGSEATVISRHEDIQARDEVKAYARLIAEEGDVTLGACVKVTGDISAGNNITAQQKLAAGGNLRAEGYILLEEESVIDGTITAGGHVTLGRKMTVNSGNIRSREGNITLQSGRPDQVTVINGKVDNGLATDVMVADMGSVILSTYASITSNIHAGKDITTEGGECVIKGNLQAAGKVFLGAEGYVTGNIDAKGDVVLGEKARLCINRDEDFAAVCDSGNIVSREGNIWIKSGTFVEGDVIAKNGNVIVEEGAVVKGKIEARGDITVGKASSNPNWDKNDAYPNRFGNIISFNGNVTLHKGVALALKSVVRARQSIVLERGVDVNMDQLDASNIIDKRLKDKRIHAPSSTLAGVAATTQAAARPRLFDEWGR